MAVKLHEGIVSKLEARRQDLTERLAAIETAAAAGEDKDGTSLEEELRCDRVPFCRTFGGGLGFIIG